MNQIQRRRLILVVHPLLFVFVVTLFSCRQKQKFDKKKWAEAADLMTFSNRKYMIGDLVETRRLDGKTYRELTQLLGPLQSKLDSTLEVAYDIDADYGYDIDPVSVTTFFIHFNRDTVVKNYELREWKK